MASPRFARLHFAPLVFAGLGLVGCGGPAPPPPPPDFAGSAADLVMGPCKDNTTCSGQTPYCDTGSGKCVPCVKNEHCPMGQVCKDQKCIPGEVLPDAAMGSDAMMMGGDMPPAGDDAMMMGGDGGGPCVEGMACALGGMGGMGLCCKGVCLDTSGDNNNCGMCGNACGGGKSCCAGACADFQNDAKNCGGCNIVCNLQNAMGACKAGKCALDKCNDGFGDCDMVPDNGCETDLNGDPANCQGCGNTCAAAHGTAGCAKGCTVAKCDDGWGDCDKAYGNGCEVDLVNSLANCGMCNQNCGNVANGTAACAAGKCVVASCNGSFQDCNMNGNDGCESDTAKDVANCGMCAKKCPPVPNGNPGCAGAACGVASCNAPFKDCNVQAMDGCEANTDTDPKNCGACGNNCPAVANGVPGCAAGKCVVASCNAGFDDCNKNYADGCETNLRADVKNCGKCSMVCPVQPNSAPVCDMGVCKLQACNAPFKDCDGNPGNGCEINLSTDINNCGACAKVCANVANGTKGCVNSACVISACNAGFKDCNNNVADGCEVNLSNDVNNCNACGQKCTVANGAAACTNGTCAIASCSAGFKDCKNGYMDGCETNTGGDVNNCGACGTKCTVANGTPGCANGACGIASCSAGYANCDNNVPSGCETNTTNNLSHCGACNNKCPTGANATPGCSNSKCGLTCNAPYANCDGNAANGCEINSSNDVKNCGSCGNACPPGVGCNNGSCKDAVYVIHASSYANDVKSKLDATGAFAKVDLFDARSGTPSLAQIQAYQAVLVFSDGGFQNSVALGDNLANYFDGGGRVVVATFANTSILLSGRWNTGGYHLIQPAAQAQPNEQGALQINEPGSPLLANVAALRATAAYRSTGAVINGGVVVARWGSGTPLIVRGIKNNKALVSLNFYPPSSSARGDFWVGDGAAILRNALQFRRFSFAGVRTNLPISSLTGWTQCYLGKYGVSGVSLAGTVLAACNKANLMVACRQTGSATLTVAAHAPRTAVLTDTAGGQCNEANLKPPTISNGVAWYYNNSWSWGFFNPGDGVNRCSCDTAGTNPQLRVCYHTSGGNLSGGYRCGSVTGLNGDMVNYERIIFHAD